MKCPHCSTDNAGNAKFCLECGKALVQTKTCVLCYSSIPANAKFCPQCKADQSDNPFVLSDSEILRLQSMFLDSVSGDKLRPKLKTGFSQREWDTITAGIQFLPKEKLLVYIPQPGGEIMRMDSVIEKAEFNGNLYSGALFVTNYRFIILNPKGNKSLRYKDLQSYNLLGGRTMKKISLEFGSASGDKHILYFATPHTGTATTLLSIFSSDKDPQQEAQNQRAEHFYEALSEWTAYISKRWK